MALLPYSTYRAHIAIPEASYLHTYMNKQQWANAEANCLLQQAIEEAQ